MISSQEAVNVTVALSGGSQMVGPAPWVSGAGSTPPEVEQELKFKFRA